MAKLLDIFNKKQTLEDRVKSIQNGYEEDKNNLIQEYIPFIKKVISNQLGSYVEVENDDSFSVGLLAFNEAIEKYNENKGNFLTFASIVIKSRLIDQLRKESRRSKEILASNLKNEDEAYPENIIAIDGFESKIETKLDFQSLVHNMNDFGVSLEDLINEAPKHEDTRKMAIKIGRHVFENKELCQKLLKTKNLPTSDIMRDLKISKKVIQRSRKFIIAIVLILESDLDTLKKYISNSERRQAMIYRGNIIKVKEDSLVVMLEDCTFQHVKRFKGLEEGMEIYFEDRDIVKKTSLNLKNIALIAASIFLFIATAFYGIDVWNTNYKAIALVSVDINPSIEIKINKNHNVINATALNEDAKKLPLKDLKNKSIDNALQDLVNMARVEGYIKETEENYILVTSVDLIENTEEEKILTNLIADGKEKIENSAVEVGQQVQVIAIQSNKETLKEAKKENISVGKREIFQNNSVNEIKDKNSKIEKEKDKIDKNLKDLEEEANKLREKLKELQEHNQNNGNNKDNTSNNKNIKLKQEKATPKGQIQKQSEDSKEKSNQNNGVVKEENSNNGKPQQNNNSKQNSNKTQSNNGKGQNK